MTVTVMPGETLGAIARRFDVTVQEVMSANNISDPRKVRAGQTLTIPTFKGVGTGNVPPAAPAYRPPAPATTPAPAQQSEPVTPPPATPPAPAPQEIPVEAPIVPVDEPMPTP